MNKPQLCLALGVSLALLQANLLPAFSQSAHSALAAGEAAPNVMTAGAVSSSGHVMLFLRKAKAAESEKAGAPAAALTIHTSLPEQLETPVAKEPVGEKPTLLAMSELPSEPLTTSDSVPATRQLIAQIAPDRIVATNGGVQGAPTATPIPPVVTGTVELEEFKTSNVVDLKVSQSRAFKLREPVTRTSISDPSIAEPVVVAENQLVLLGKAPGTATLVIWDAAGNSLAVDLNVSRDFSGLQAALREIDPRIVVKPFSVAGGDRVILLGDVDYPESVLRAFAVANAFMDDRGMNIVAANGRLVEPRVGERGTGGAATTGGQSGQLAQIAQVDRYTFFSNNNNNVSRAQSMLSDGGRVTSLIKVRKVPLIVLHCTFMEVSTAAARELATQLGWNFVTDTFAFGVGGNNSFGAGLTTPRVVAPAIGQVNPTQSVAGSYVTSPGAFLNANTFANLLGAQQNISGIGLGVINTGPGVLRSSQQLFGVPAGVVFNGGNLGNIFTATSTFARQNQERWTLNPLVQGLITQQRARVLAEPTLATLSGERAAFLAGGEIPILQAAAVAGQTQQSVVFEPFGLRLNMLPLLQENGSIHLQVSPEERLLSQVLANNIIPGASAIPGFTVRKAQTTVELKPGQELFIAGLVSANSGRDQTRTPLIGEVPVLGALYRSKAFAKNESELIVAIRPEIVLPGTPGQMRLPEEISKVEGPRDMNMLQVEPTIIDERYMTSGQADRGMRVAGELPPGAPIPDAQ